MAVLGLPFFLSIFKYLYNEKSGIISRARRGAEII